MKRSRFFRRVLPAALLTALPLVLAAQIKLAGAFAAGGDLIGTLPSYFTPSSSTGGGGGGSASPAHLDAASPSWEIRGPLRFLEGMLQDAYGDGFVLVSGSSVEREVQLNFHGDVVVELGRSAVQAGKASFGLALGQHFQGGVGYLEWNGKTSDPFALGRALHVPMANLLAAGLLDQGGMTIHLVSRRGQEAHFHVEAFGNVIQLKQMVP
jgi:hypothetical protein